VGDADGLYQSDSEGSRLRLGKKDEGEPIDIVKTEVVGPSNPIKLISNINHHLVTLRK
jgi:hypothetical protein